MLQALSMEAFCLEISNFLYGEDSKMDRKPIHFLIKILVKKYVFQSEYTEECAKHMCKEIAEQCLPFVITHHSQINNEHMNSLVEIVYRVIFTDILDQMTWNELKSDINSKLT
jgi:hypothetical protein